MVCALEGEQGLGGGEDAGAGGPRGRGRSASSRARATRWIDDGIALDVARASVSVDRVDVRAQVARASCGRSRRASGRSRQLVRQKGGSVWPNGTMIWPLKLIWGSSDVDATASAACRHTVAYSSASVSGRVPEGEGGAGGSAGLARCAGGVRGHVPGEERGGLVAVGALLQREGSGIQGLADRLRPDRASPRAAPGPGSRARSPGRVLDHARRGARRWISVQAPRRSACRVPLPVGEGAGQEVLAEAIARKRLQPPIAARRSSGAQIGRRGYTVGVDAQLSEPVHRQARPGPLSSGT